MCDCANCANTDWFLEALVPLAENPWFYKQVVSFLHQKVSFNLFCLLVSFPSSFVSDGCDIIVTDRVSLLRHFAALECFFLIQMHHWTTLIRSFQFDFLRKENVTIRNTLRYGRKALLVLRAWLLCLQSSPTDNIAEIEADRFWSFSWQSLNCVNRIDHCQWTA